MSERSLTEYDAIREERLRRHVAVIESACEAALQGGHHGVMVEWNGQVTSAWVSPDVPYGEIHERVLPSAKCGVCEWDGYPPGGCPHTLPPGGASA